MISPKNRYIIYSAFAGIIIALWFFNQPDPLPVLGNIPHFEMTDSENKPFGTRDLSGKIWVADFIFTTCAGPCPIMSSQMSIIHNTFLNDELVNTVSFTVNPDYDTPDVLSAYADQLKAKTDKWHFLTASYDEIKSIIINGFKMGDTEEIVFHSTRFALVDREMKIRGYYIGTEKEDVEKLIVDIRKLKKE